ncbi:MAG: antibiotic biosynthesis monooxygenase [Anaerolineae bacterium]|nr:antibiotic biosynthesis monooxygenase [Anaerolineae bacterium]
MIARIWHGMTRASDADSYMEYLNHTGLPDYRATPGNLGVTVLRRIEGDVAHFTLISYWDSLDTIRAFAGDTIEVARYYPEDDAFLLEKEPTVTHHEVLAQ